MDQKKSRQRKLWMIPLSVLLLAGGLVCLWMLWLSMQFTLPVKAEVTQSLSTEPVMNRDDFVWVPPTEAPTEPEPEPEPDTYQLTINMADVQSYHNAVSDVVGWIRIKDTVINYPIVQTNNNSYYTNHTWQGASSHAGAIFADWRCTLDNTDNALIYGHNMANGSMLHAIKNYKSEEWGRQHMYFEVASLTHRYLYKVISVNVLYGEAGASFDYWNYINMNRPGYQYFYDRIKSTALIIYEDEDEEAPRDNNDRLIALQTCNSGQGDGIRCIVFARCLGDFTNVDTYVDKETKMDPPQR